VELPGITFDPGTRTHLVPNGTVDDSLSYLLLDRSAVNVTGDARRALQRRRVATFEA